MKLVYGTYTHDRKEAMSSKCAFIPDGYTLEATIPETEWYPAVKVEYRPAVRETQVRVSKRIASNKDTEDGQVAAERMADEAVVAQLVTWDLGVEITAANVGRLDPHFRAALFNLVMGYKSLAELYREVGKEPPKEPDAGAAEKN